MSLEIDWGSLKTHRQPHPIFRANIGLRMTTMKLQNGDLFVHSPIPLNQELKQDLDDFGMIKWVVAPNDFHHLYIRDFMAIYQSAEYIGSPGLRTKRPDLEFSRYFSNEYKPQWKNEIDFVVYQGSKYYHEVIFFHYATQTLILTDLAMNLQSTFKSFNPFHALLFSILGTYKKFNSSLMIKMLSRNKNLARQALLKIYQWPFERIIMSHGEIINSNARMQLIQCLKWLN